MVNLVEDWKDIEVYTCRLSHDVKTGSYMLRKAEDSAEIKVRVGQFGYAGRFKPRVKAYLTPNRGVYQRCTHTKTICSNALQQSRRRHCNSDGVTVTLINES